MGQLGFSEMFVIAIVALLVFGPKKLPELGKSLGKGLREFKKATNELKSTWEDQIKDAGASLDEVKQTIHATTHDLNNELNRSVKSEFDAAAEHKPADAATPGPEPHASTEKK